MRTMVLNASYEYLGIHDWFKAHCLVLEEKATVLETYNRPIRSAYETWKMPAVIVMKSFVNTKKRARSFSASTRNVLIRDDFTCQYCGCKLSTRTGTKDHVIPVSSGGKTTMLNLVAACKPCNSRKDNRSCKEANMYPLNPGREMSDEEKLRSVMKTFQTRERSVWLDCLKKNGISLW